MKKKNIFKPANLICQECGADYKKWETYTRRTIEDKTKTGSRLTTEYLMEKRACLGCGKTQIRDVECYEGEAL